MGASGLKGSGSGNSGFDLAAIQQALGENITMLQNRYNQLGLGVPQFHGQTGPMTGPGGIGALAANAGQSLGAVAGMPTTAEATDISGMQLAGQAGLGQLQNANQSNAGIPGTTANALQNIASANQNTGTNNFNAGASQPTGIPSGTS